MDDMTGEMEVSPTSLALREIYDQLVEITKAISNLDCNHDTLNTLMILASGSMLGIAQRGLNGDIPNHSPQKPWRISIGGKII